MSPPELGLPLSHEAIIGPHDKMIVPAANPLIRRRALVHILARFAIGSAAIPTLLDARAKVKFSKTKAQYQDQPMEGFTCSACSEFVRPKSCKVVAGDVSPSGWCKFFALVD
jgi:hypothetical protein